MSSDRLSSVIEALYQELKCSVCFSMFTEPHSLPCLHIFCKACVDRCLTIRPNCPLCNANFHRRQVDPCGVISCVIDVYKKLYKALSAVADIPCLSQALMSQQLPVSVGKAPNPMKQADSTDKACSSPESFSTIEHTNLDGELPQRTFPDHRPGSSIAQNSHDQTSASVGFRTLTTPIRSRKGQFRSAADDADIEPWSPFESSMLKMPGSRCSICFESDSRPLLFCSRCNVAVHFVCYGIAPDTSSSQWLCCPCESGVSTKPQCVLCPNTDDRAFRPCAGEPNAWIHVSCALWAPQPRFSETAFGNGGLVEDVAKVPTASRKLCCMICRKRGFCLQCEYGRCVTAFHVPCAARSKVRLELRGLDDKVYFHQLCPSHSHLSNEVPTDNTAGSALSRRSQRRTSFSPSPAPKRRNSLAASRSCSRHPGRFVLLLTGFQLNDKMSKLLSMSKNVDVTMNLSHTVTHVVTKCYSSGPQGGKAIARTVKYMFGIAKGLWCVSQFWIHDWVKFGNAPDELNYEVLGDYAATGAPRRSRVCRQQGKSPLFGGVDFIISGPFSKNLGLHIELAEIIKAAGGSILNSIPDRQPLRPTVLIKEPVDDEDESERREYASIRQQCLKIGIAMYDVQWLFNLLSYYTSPLVPN